MGSYSDSTSDLDEELPVFDFLQPGRHLRQTSQSRQENPHLVCLDGSDTEQAANVMMISSDSDGDEPYVPLAQRLKQRQDNVISASSTVTNGKDAGRRSPSSLASSHLSCQNGSSEPECPLSSHQGRTAGRGVSGGPDEVAALPRRWKPFSAAGSADASPAKRKPAKRMVEEVQASREEAVRRRQARETQQRGKEALRQEQERQKAERKALAEAAKALRPEECIKHMVVAVDPGKENTK